ncbi:uncharacterized protein N7515_001403 [Penicillium bovifimosum]|uniref:Uncharacterized protein n=1 Tax=Penicillium bovifimosum TaxID=126998 RepID=A0A9W9H9L8_9EURO|nr:uncharacterized protein N7515_001403 [Penicillium bovifimosum]KAJ5142616.1 hypothetical protein N7515_001403 [Penicillium bovifimosum]
MTVHVASTTYMKAYMKGSPMSLICFKNGVGASLSSSNTGSITIMAPEESDVQTKKLGILRTLFTDDSGAIIKDIRDDPIMVDIMDVAIEYLVQEIRAEFGELRRLSTFGQWKADEDVRQLDMSMMGKELSEHAPLFTNLMTELACNTNARSNGYVRKEEESYLVMLASILLLKSSRNTTNRFARMLGFYLQPRLRN